MLQNNFYTILEQKIDDEEAVFKIRFNPLYIIYNAHFRGNPITPGACIVQIIKELASLSLNKSLMIKEIKNLKFINVIIPHQYPEVFVQFSLVNDDITAIYHLKGTVYVKEEIFSKFSFIMSCC